MCLSLCASQAQAQADRPVLAQSVQYPHTTGYQLGDQFEHVLTIEIRRPYTIVADSLPSIGRVSDYIELQDVRVNKSIRFKSRVYKVSLQYQVINYDDSLVGTSVPPVLMSFSTDADVYPVVIGQWGLTLSPFLLKAPLNPGTMPVLEGLAKEVALPLWRSAVSGLLLLLVGTVLLLPTIRYRFIGSFNRKRNRPFTKAYRCIRKLKQGCSSASFSKSLRCLHEAFNKTMGRTMLSEDIDAFLQLYPMFNDNRGNITRFFELSDRTFFQCGDSMKERQSVIQVKAIADAMRRAEWGLPMYGVARPDHKSAHRRNENTSVRQSIEILKP